MVSAWKWFQNLLHGKFCKMAEKLNFMVFRAVFLFEVHIQQSYWKKKLNNWKKLRNPQWLLKNAKNIWLQTALKDFWSPANPKLNKSSLWKLLLLQDHTEQNARVGGSGELLLSSSELKYFSIESFWIKA